MLYLVPSPIGNLADITFRAIEILKSVDVILAEDTSTSSKLLKHYGISKPISPYHQHNEHKIVAHLADQLVAGKSFALITDAGTPGISDPAFLLVRECVKQNIEVNACRVQQHLFLLWLIVACQLHRFTFEGFFTT